MAVLGALGKTGDLSALPAVRELATHDAYTEASREVRAAAEECLRVLEAAARERRDHYRLVRPAASPAIDLLRPVTPEAPLGERGTHLQAAELPEDTGRNEQT